MWPRAAGAPDLRSSVSFTAWIHGKTVVKPCRGTPHLHVDYHGHGTGTSSLCVTKSSASRPPRRARARAGLHITSIRTMRSHVHAMKRAALQRLNVVLISPVIPANTGSIGRTVMAAGCRLHLVHPLGFSLEEKALRRAGLDYWPRLDCTEHPSWDSFASTCLDADSSAWLFTTHSDRPHWEADFAAASGRPHGQLYLLFGSETAGAASEVHDLVRTRWGDAHRVTLPMHPEARSINLSASVCAGVYEAVRQLVQASV